MCGILLNISSKGVDANRFIKSLDLLEHRGPDSKNFAWYYDDSNFLNRSKINKIEEKKSIQMMMGHTRLSILDLSDYNNQPMISKNDDYVLMYNGEIYNYKEVRKELENEGVSFDSDGDTEVLFKALIYWGLDCVKKLNGMWAFVFYDVRNATLSLSRDPFGKKPLYYHFNDNNLIVSSEFKSIFSFLDVEKRKVSSEYLCSYLFYDHAPTFQNGDTFYSDIKSVEPGTLLSYNKRTRKFTKNNHNLLSNYLNCIPNVKNLERDLSAAVDIRLRADVPIGVLISGGIDSSLVAAFARKNGQIRNKNIIFYTANSPNSKDIKYAKIIANSLGIKLKIIDIPYDSKGISNFREMIKQYEIPMPLGGAANSAYYLFSKISEDGVKVVLDGTGGDELFAGYYKEYRTGYVMSLIYSFKFVSCIKEKSRFHETYLKYTKYLNHIFLSYF